MEILLVILAVILVVAGLIKLFGGQYLLGAVLVILGFLVGPGGISLF